MVEAPATFETIKQALAIEGATGSRTIGCISPFDFIALRGRIESTSTQEALRSLVNSLTDEVRTLAKAIIIAAENRLAA